MEQLHEKLKRLRTDRGITQKFLANKAGLSHNYLSELERGRRSPSTENLYAIAQALDMSVDALLFGIVLYKWDKPWRLIPSNEYAEMVLED